jgi:hypothetical protein
MYKVTGTIDKWDDIPWDARIIVTGSIDGSRAWMLRMPGVFKKDSGDYRFVDDFGIATHFKRDGRISLNILERSEVE